MKELLTILLPFLFIGTFSYSLPSSEKSNFGERRGFKIGDKGYVISQRQKSWYEAKYDCLISGDGYELLSLESNDELVAIRNQLGDYAGQAFWTSGFSHSTFGYASQMFYWDSTGRSIGPYEGWGTTRPYNLTANTCILFNDGDTDYWSVTNSTKTCSSLSLWYICEKPLEPIAVDTQLPPENIDGRYRFSFGDGVYDISNMILDWFSAKNDCKLRGMRLVSIESQEEDEAIYKEISQYEEGFWTSGAKFLSTGPFSWDSTGHGLGPYLNWYKNYPVDFEKYNCVIMRPAFNYTWENYFCADGYYGITMNRYICEWHPGML
ncbi:Hypothetical predicted protein [Cloeon dipterum]|uniref:C-type lectin domain-containing protein n=1 Tax=Cloeon dipterum TaxID=197152 RepID=A0A8S1D420_9INSE|nr:Hypothetical predicted protein [Cloeon dipterum]